MSRSTHFGDGSRFADVGHDRRNPETQKVIHINHEYWTEDQDNHKQLPGPLSYLYVGREPLPEALSKAQSLGQGEVMGRECNIFLFTDVRSRVRDQVFYLDQETSIPLRVESFKDQASRDKKEPIAVWTAQSLDQVQGHFVTLESTSVRYAEDGTPRITWNFHVESIEFDKEYPASTFWPTFQPGAVVFDATTEKTYTVPGAKPEAKDETATSAQPIQATPPRDWSSIASNTALTLGCVIVIVAGLMWWRRR